MAGAVNDKYPSFSDAGDRRGSTLARTARELAAQAMASRKSIDFTR